MLLRSRDYSSFQYHDIYHDTSHSSFQKHHKNVHFLNKQKYIFPKKKKRIANAYLSHPIQKGLIYILPSCKIHWKEFTDPTVHRRDTYRFSTGQDIVSNETRGVRWLHGSEMRVES